MYAFTMFVPASIFTMVSEFKTEDSYELQKTWIRMEHDQVYHSTGETGTFY